MKKPNVKSIPTSSLKADRQAITSAESNNPFGNDIQSNSNPFGNVTPPFEKITINNVNRSVSRAVRTKQ
jgi:hypothetical protein